MIRKVFIKIFSFFILISSFVVIGSYITRVYASTTSINLVEYNEIDILNSTDQISLFHLISIMKLKI